MRRSIWRGLTAGALVVGLTVATAAVLTSGPATPSAGEIVSGRVEGTAAGAVDYSVYLPPGYAAGDAEYPVIYLLHGRGDTQAAWQRIAGDLDELIAAGDIQPIIAVMPDSPWNDRGNWYTDSAYTGPAASGPGVAVETALAVDLVDHIDATFRTVDDREGRAVGGYSMGGRAPCGSRSHTRRTSPQVSCSARRLHAAAAGRLVDPRLRRLRRRQRPLRCGALRGAELRPGPRGARSGPAGAPVHRRRRRRVAQPRPGRGPQRHRLRIGPALQHRPPGARHHGRAAHHGRRPRLGRLAARFPGGHRRHRVAAAHRTGRPVGGGAVRCPGR
ncbi:hypothetical protein G7085_12760 [Tessaracoccus sp. HDW20]|nr:hypothetical protein [Tessaracoccus coleopterorum]